MASTLQHNNIKFDFKKLFLNAATLIFLALCQTSQAAIDLAKLPLNITGTSTAVLPNIMYILDNSGSMGLDFMADNVDDPNKCKSTGTSGVFSANCAFGDPPRMSSTFNSIYYNPEITYSPGLNANKSSKTSMDSAATVGWTQVPLDAYGIQGGNTTTSLVPSSTDATKGYLDRVWCNTGTATTANLSDPLVCKKNSQYIFPNNTGSQTSSFNQSYNYRGHPYYYTVAVGEFCTDKNLTTCIAATAPSTGFTYPAKLRWCNSSARTNCQAKYIEGTSYTFAKWSGISTGNLASSKIKIIPDNVGCGGAGQPTCTAPSAIDITDITVDAVRIVASPVPTNLNITNTTSSTNRNLLANNIASAINAYVPATGSDFIATALGDEVTVSRVGAGAFFGTIDVTSNSVAYAGTAGVQAQGKFSVTKVGKDQSTSSANNSRCDNSSSAATNCPVTVEVNQVSVGSPSNTIITSGTITYSTGALNSASGSNNTTRFGLATLIKDNINTTVSSPFDYTASCGPGTAGSGVTCTTEVVTITALAQGTATHGSITITSAVISNALSSTIKTSNLSIGSISNMGNLTAGVAGISARTYTILTSLTQFTGGTPTVNSFNRVDIEPTTPTYPKASGRSDCGDRTFTTCTYAEEMTNFANWYSYYRTRMQMMKTSTSHAFKQIDSKYRVGFITIANQDANYVPIADFNLTQKTSWYNQLLATAPVTATPLRSALSFVGRIFAGKKPVGTSDPMQFSCQQNYAILTTDGYWNGGTGAQLDGITDIGNLDGTNGSVQTPRPLYEGPTAVSNSLADVAKYYYDTDLRTGAPGSAACTGSLRSDGTTGDVCANNVFVTPTDNNLQQHMTTFTLGLGVDATLTYDKDYKTATSGDFYDLKQGSINWSVPAPNAQSAVDDLWHAAVNGQGTYFSAKNPSQLSTSLSDALSSIDIKTGSGAAAATSTLQPVKDDNFAYVASYTSVKWSGNLEKRTVSTITGAVSEDAVWCLENVSADTSCEAPGSIATEPASVTNGNTAKAYCVTPGATAVSCTLPNILDGSDCKVEVATACTGTMAAKVSSSSDSRTIYMNKGGALDNFNYSNLLSEGKNANFENSYLQTKLTQWPDLTVDQRTAVNGTSLVNFLRGSTGFEDRSDNVVGVVDNRIYRKRETTLGDLANSPPVFVGAPKANFNDPGYGPSSTTGTYKNNQASRAGMVYVGSNDGMLHAIDASTGEERWAFVPSAVIPELYKLADKKYSENHSYFVDGELIINDICTNNCSSASATWKTILVGGLNNGGKGYFALDITNPIVPLLMWEYGVSADYAGDTSYDSDLGYSYGNPIITKKADGTWVVLITSGYNNASDTGFLSVLDAVSGNPIGSKYSTGGDSTNPAGLAKISGYVEDSNINNTVTFVYGGDLLGNLWRFDINNAVSSNNPFKLAELKGPATATPSNKPQPITVRPELGNISGKRVVFIGTGRYLGKTDLSNTDQQSFYAISDDNFGTFTTLVNPRASAAMVQQILVNDGSTGTRTVQNPQDVPSNKRGWFFDFPDSKERQNIPAQLVFGTLLVPSIVPENTDCSPGGYGWLNFLDYKTGKSVSGNLVGVKTNSPIVGLNVLYVGGKPVTNIVTAANPTPTNIKEPPYVSGGSGEFTNHRVIWRELIDEE